MLVSENGKLIELPEDVRPTDKYKIYENTLVVNYAERKMYSFYVQQATGLKKYKSQYQNYQKRENKNYQFR